MRMAKECVSKTEASRVSWPARERRRKRQKNEKKREKKKNRSGSSRWSCGCIAPVSMKDKRQKLETGGSLTRGNERLSFAQVRRVEAPYADRERGQEGGHTTRVGGEEMEETGCRNGAVGCRERTGYDDKELAVRRRQTARTPKATGRACPKWAAAGACRQTEETRAPKSKINQLDLVPSAKRMCWQRNGCKMKRRQGGEARRNGWEGSGDGWEIGPLVVISCRGPRLPERARNEKRRTGEIVGGNALRLACRNSIDGK